jgi:hypothetical protein
MKKIFIPLLMVIFAFTPKITMNAQSPCDIVYNFETDPDPAFLSYSEVTSGGNSVSNTSISIIEEPGTSNHVLKMTTAQSYGGGGYLQLKVTLPSEKTLADYNALKFDYHLISGDVNSKYISYYIN